MNAAGVPLNMSDALGKMAKMESTLQWLVDCGEE